MAQLQLQARRGQQDAAPSERLKMCEYAVMGEEKLVLEPGPHGYVLDLNRATVDHNVITVGKIWQLAESHSHEVLFTPNPRLKRLCLSFALFKLLRRRFEHLPLTTKEETDLCRDLIFEYICGDKGIVSDQSGVALFQLLKDEISFMCEYHHSVYPVVLASPRFLVVNYLVFPLVVAVFCFMTLAISAKGHMMSALSRIMVHNGIFTVAECLWKNVLRSQAAFFSAIDISISYLLFIAFIYEEVEEFLVLVLSNWFVVSMLSSYTAKPRQSPAYSGTLHCISWVNEKLSFAGFITFKQLSVLSVSWLPMMLPTVSLPKQAKSLIMERLFSSAGSPAPLSNGQYVLDCRPQERDLSWFCESDSIAEVILTWHIATSLLEMPCRQGQEEMPWDDHKVVAARLSKYCAYLVAFHPELLPDDLEGTKHAYKVMKKDLKDTLGCWDYYFAPERDRYDKMMAEAARSENEAWPDCRQGKMNVVQKGAILGKMLIEESKAGERSIWELLAHLWVELIVYVAPSSREEQVKGHEEALGQGGELITLLWTLATHTGLTRPPPKSIVIQHVEDVEEMLRQRV
ncbi:hypothetical protein ZWY2020_010459 [Hordeum vulgare]|nr:hypothetical protein ZWY2020_010459 [Hordeum vulgare]